MTIMLASISSNYCNAIFFCFFIFLPGISFCQIVNIESQRIITDTVGWSGDLGISVSASKNTKSYFTFNGHGHLQFKSHKNLFLSILDYNLVHAGNEDFDNTGFGHLRYNRKVSDLFSFEAFTQFQFNEITKIELRSLNGLGFRLKLSQYERSKFYYGLAYMFEYEEVKDVSFINKDHRMSSYFSFTLKPEETVVFSNTTYIQPKLNEFRDYRLSNNTRLVFNITTHLKFVTQFNFLFDARPPEGVPRSSYEVKNGLNYRF
jgi:hypothetical protein